MNPQCTIRSPVCTVVGHVDHGKSSILDKIRGSAIVDTEPGKITQHIGASLIPIEVIKTICGDLLSALKTKITVPGLLFIDTPGHAAFTHLRKRGGNLADIAVLVVDINEGFKPQTVEALDILKTYKTPFIVAANKIDLIPGYESKEGFLIQSLNSLSETGMKNIETKLYELVGKLNELGYPSDRFDRVDDLTKTVAIVPCSAKTGQGIPELLMLITGIAQKFLEKCLECDVTGQAKGTVLEVKEEKGLGTTLDAIIYDGSLSINDTIIIGGIDEPVVTKIKALLVPAPLKEMRDKKTKFSPVKSICAAAGVKISAPDVDKVVAGMPIQSCNKQNMEKIKRLVQAEVEEVIVETDEQGIIIKADSLGSLEALVKLFRDHGAKIRKAMIGNLSKRDIMDAESSYAQNPTDAVIICFNVGFAADAEPYSRESRIKIFSNNIIYKLIEDFDVWKSQEEERKKAAQLESMALPCKMQIMPQYIFRQSNPAIVGVDIIEGRVRKGAVLMKDGKNLTDVKSMQKEKESVDIARKGDQVAMALPGVTVGRQIDGGDILYSSINEEEFRKLKELRTFLSEGEITILKEIAEIMRKSNVTWGI